MTFEPEEIIVEEVVEEDTGCRRRLKKRNLQEDEQDEQINEETDELTEGAEDLPDCPEEEVTAEESSEGSSSGDS